VKSQEQFFRLLGERARGLRKKHEYSQEDMMSFGFSTRHWQQIEAGRPITVTTLLRICEVFEITMEKLVRGLDKGIYEKPGPERGPVSKRRK
jgi:transcriptional regulator with XRE-family HTH domain